MDRGTFQISLLKNLTRRKGKKKEEWEEDILFDCGAVLSGIGSSCSQELRKAILLIDGLTIRKLGDGEKKRSVSYSGDDRKTVQNANRGA